MEENSIITGVRKFIETNILAPGIKLEEETNLQNAGVDSFSTVEIILFIERNYSIAIPDDQLVPENFKTLRSLARLVNKLSA